LSNYAAPRSFSERRVRSAEHLDLPATDERERARSYHDLDRISRLPFQFGPLWRIVRRLAGREAPPGSPIRLLELGAGTGAVGLRIARRLAARGRRVELLSSDIRTEQLPPPREGPELRIVPLRIDLLTDELPSADVILANLVVHHFDDRDVREILRRLAAAATLGAVVYDLERSRRAFHLFRWFFPLWAKSPVTVADSLLSVQQAFRAEELMAIAREAGVKVPRVRRYFGLRILLWWETERPAASQP
jgi:SAM-dependent methyltransferase